MRITPEIESIVVAAVSEKEATVDDDAQLQEKNFVDDVPITAAVKSASDTSNDDAPIPADAAPEMSAEQIQMFKTLIEAKAREIMQSKKQ